VSFGLFERFLQSRCEDLFWSSRGRLGTPREEAPKGLTINSAEIQGAGDELGSIEKGNLADLI
jgi:imidazolonepropionase-like amidohydrolase